MGRLCDRSPPPRRRVPLPGGNTAENPLGCGGAGGRVSRSFAKRHKLRKQRCTQKVLSLGLPFISHSGNDSIIAVEEDQRLPRALEGEVWL